MAKQVAGVSDRLLQCAETEFLKQGFENASLRTIAENAGTSTGSIYTRFQDKLGLYNAVVDPALQQITALYNRELSTFDEKHRNMPWQQMFEYTTNEIGVLVDAIYSNFNALKLASNNANDKKFENFIHELAVADAAYTEKYIDDIGNDALTSGRLHPPIIHVICSVFWDGVFEVVRHNMDKEIAAQYVKQLKTFFQGGWESMFSG